MKNQKTGTETSSQHSKNINNDEQESENIGVWEATKEGVAKAWGATKREASKAWDKTKEVTEDITGFGHNEHDDDTAYFEDEEIADKYGNNWHHFQGYAEDSDNLAAFNETDEEPLHHQSAHLHKNSSAQHQSCHNKDN